MLAVRTAVFACLVLAACDGNPFVAPDSGPTPGSNGSVSTLTSTLSGKPSSTGSISRTEVHGTGPSIDGSAPDVVGNGYAQDYTYDAKTDKFKIDNLAFDGGNTYKRSASLPNLGAARVYEAASSYADPQTGQNIDQLSYRALYGVSTTGRYSSESYRMMYWLMRQAASAPTIPTW